MVITALAAWPVAAESGYGRLAVGLILAGVVSGPIDVALLTLRQCRTDPQQLGRIMSISAWIWPVSLSQLRIGRHGDYVIAVHDIRSDGHRLCRCGCRDDIDPLPHQGRCLIKRCSAGNQRDALCEVCGKEAVHAHHDQYDEPLKVRWLCRRQHAKHQHHREDLFPIRPSC
jgi:hypothetical protein